jgi:hypothetical protein
MHFGYLYIDKTFLKQPVLKILLYFVFTMNQEQFLNLPGILATEKLAQIIIISMGAHTAHFTDFGVHLVVQPKYRHFFRMALEPSPE